MIAGKLPPGQIETIRFPVVGERAPSEEIADPMHWRLSIGGLVATPVTLTFDDYMSLGHQDLTVDIHCVTGWSRLGNTFTGVPVRDLLDKAEPKPEAAFVSFTAYSTRGHHVSLPLDVVVSSSWLVHRHEGEPLTAEHGGPVRVVTPGKYFYKSLKWVKEIELLEQDRLGWWETNSSYHNNADPWSGTERFTTGSMKPSQIERFLHATSYDKYRGRVMLGLDLRDWEPVTKDLRRLHLKNCDLSGVDLSDADLRESNLSLSRLRNTRLAGADLSGSDLEGADFAGADLRGANLEGTALSATRFDGALVEAARFDGAWGLLESEQAYLAHQGIPVGS